MISCPETGYIIIRKWGDKYKSINVSLSVGFCTISRYIFDFAARGIILSEWIPSRLVVHPIKSLVPRLMPFVFFFVFFVCIIYTLDCIWSQDLFAYVIMSNLSSIFAVRGEWLTSLKHLVRIFEHYDWVCTYFQRVYRIFRFDSLQIYTVRIRDVNQIIRPNRTWNHAFWGRWNA